ncbi:maleylpyruvate isomerase N-terminal domain-containing protein [Streptomyces sp. NBC_00847]|uniref:maleylpyruvate isomerase N-terminal domain-containing protein n=1 Tax=Streptomyces sp. NBC_00847 TaxID=2975850 RepID=UPI0022572668|nr:maleylpyruvate isomerase N-terminal domain-containing protein [Streptomyces sp. NBC_00847]MCX4880972.1 maleylpyruvate isomerase N-terminal domain-containing protein [Streptomyces sp. NBC_00847]
MDESWNPRGGRIRQGVEATAADGLAALHARVREALGRLRDEVPKAAATRPVRVPSWGDWSLGLDDFLLTRLMELVVHADHPACSGGLVAPRFPERVSAPVVELLARLAVRRHGTVATLPRRARPASIAGIQDRRCQGPRTGRPPSADTRSSGRSSEG